jgi:large subunit ribosomal protein L13
MDALSYKTQMLNKQTVTRKWLIIDVKGQTLGRVASRIAYILRGKHKPGYTPHVDCGDKVIVINAGEIQLTGRKWDKRIHLRHTGYPGGQRAQTPRQIHAKHPTRLVEHAIKMMLPKTKLGADIFRNLYVYAGSNHPHQAQQPELYNIESVL